MYVCMYVNTHTVIYVGSGCLGNTSVLAVQSSAVQQTDCQRQAAQRATVFLQCMNNFNF